MKNPDYSKCQIYKLVCNDPTITDCYVGNTCNWKQRKYNHHSSIHCEAHPDYNIKKSSVIRDNNGWDNWSMILIEDYPCKNRLEAELRERYWFDCLKPTLNSNRPRRLENELPVVKKNKITRSLKNNKIQELKIEIDNLLK